MQNIEIEKWLISLDLKIFLESVREAYRIVKDVSSNQEEIVEKLKEMGLRYNHLVFKISEDQIRDLKLLYDDTQMIEKGILEFLREFEDNLVGLYPGEMEFFLTYRAKTNPNLKEKK
ncbi:MAG TPA: hypothetical protein DHW82_03305 [Spirochaetia bacterium]|nr:MAG: hypothetical protein A2Y41_02960 [Spirochaetes bacterium GWB1_36_13]HCL56020.1 hypothetical protein [Spirochaetia bacterium]